MNKKLNGIIEEIGDNHIFTSFESPLLPSAVETHNLAIKIGEHLRAKIERI